MISVSNLISQQYNFRHYSVEDGIAQSQVYGLCQDSRGYLWMGTRGGGMTRFDGTEFKTYTIKDGLINNYIFTIQEDSLHNLWIGTNNGLSYYNGIQFKNYHPQGKQKQTWIQEISIDHTGRLWLATNHGVMIMQKGKFTNISEKMHENKTIINTIFVDQKNGIWYGTADGLYKINETKKGFNSEKYGKSKGFYNNSITCIKQDQSGRLWIGTYGDGVYVYSGNQFFRIDEHQELYKQTILDIYFDNQNHVWLATLNKGVVQYHPQEKNFSWLTEQEGLSNNHVRSIIQDNSGNFWFGTSGGGVCHYFGKQFTMYDKSSGLAGNFIYSIFRDSKQRLWVGNSDKGVSVYDSSVFKNYSSINGFSDVKVKAITEGVDGEIYIGTDGQGLFIFDGTGFKPIPELNKRYIRAMVKDHQNNIWIATAGHGLYQLSKSNQIIELKNYTTNDGLLHPRLTSLWVDKKGRIWYGTENNGIGFVQDNQVQPLTFTTKKGLPSNAIRCVSEDLNGCLWIGTAGDGIASIGIYQSDYPIKKYDHHQGLTSSNIYLICIDQEQHIICGSEAGLDQISINNERKITQIKHFGKGEGFTGIETCQNSVWKDSDGTIWFGTINGLIKYNPSNMVKNNHEPMTNITDIKLFYETLSETPYKTFTGDWNQVHKLILPYNENHLTFDFMAVNFSNPQAVRYQWKLKGFDKNWSPVSVQHSFSYPNLSPGDYTFMVKACNEDGIWNKEPVQLHFTIKKTFWFTWWFIIICIVSIGGIVILVFKWQMNRIQKQAAEKQQKIQLEKDLVELEQKALRLQMNPHFIFNALNSIQSQIGTHQEQNARYYLAKFSRLMRQILDNSRQSTITLEEEIHTLENYLLIEKFCNGDRFDYSIQVDEKIEKDYVRIPPMLLQPFIENAIKHGLKHMNGKRGKILVEFTEKNNQLECSVTDNGIGRKKSEELNKNSKETYHQSTALIVTQERLDLLKKDTHIQSMEMIDLYDNQGEASGTKVIIRIPMT